MLKRFKRFFALTTIVALMIQAVPGISAFNPQIAKAHDLDVKTYFPISGEDFTKDMPDHAALSASELESIKSKDLLNYSTESYWKYNTNDYTIGELIKFNFAPELSGVKIDSAKLIVDSTLSYSISEIIPDFVGQFEVSVNDQVKKIEEFKSENQEIDLSNLSIEDLNSLSLIFKGYTKNGKQVKSVFDKINLVVDEHVLPAKVDLIGNILGNKAVLSWTKSPLAERYKVYKVKESNKIDEADLIASLVPEETTWQSEDDLLLGVYNYAVVATNSDGNSEPSFVSLDNSRLDYILNPESKITVASNLEMIGMGTMPANITVQDLGTEPMNPAIPNQVKVFGHYYSFNADNNRDQKAIFPVSLRFYFTKDDLKGADIKDVKQINGVYFYDNGEWKLYDQDKTGVVVKTDDQQIEFNGQEFDGYVWVNADHFCPLAQGADATAPESKVSNLADYELTNTFDVAYSATDLGGSIVDYAELYYRLNGGEWIKYTTADNLDGKFTQSPIKFTALKDGKYDFYTVAIDKAGNKEVKDGSIVDASTTVDKVIPGVVTGLRAIPADGRVVLSWDMVPGADGYIVSYLDKTIDVGKQNQVTVIGLTNGTNYQFTVTGYRLVGNRIGLSAVISSTPNLPVKASEPKIETVVPKAEAAEVTPEVKAPQAPKIEADQQQNVETPTQSDDQGQVKGDETTETKNWTTTIVILSILVVLAAAVSGYYGYEWWASKPRKKANSKKKKETKNKKDNSRW